MTIESEFSVWNVTAAEDLSGAGALYKIVSIAGTIAAGPSLAVGVLRSKNISGGQVSAVFKGITKVVLGAAVTTPGYPFVTAATSGFAIAASSGGVHHGRLLNTGAVASGDLVTALVDFSTKPAWPGT